MELRRETHPSNASVPPQRPKTRPERLQLGLEMSSATDSEDLWGEKAMGGGSSDWGSLLSMDVGDSWLQPT